MADYSEEINDAIEMIEEFGGAFTVTRPQQVVPDPDEPWRRTPGVDQEFTVTGVMLEFKKTQQSQGFTAGSEDSKFILPGDMVVYIAAGDPRVTFPPMPRDEVLTPRGGTYGVVDNLMLAPNGDAILYKLWVRK